ncbi:MAG: ATP-binding protein, partial [Robiginitomaculum sp.]|nr:ATP-binding protein [Robiginitomaculum sp.]
MSDSDFVQALKAETPPEGLYVDYKAQNYGSNNKGKGEFVKDVIAFANAEGGSIIIGIKEENRIPVVFDGFECADIDDEINLLNAVIRDSIEHRLMGGEFHQHQISETKFILKLSIPKSRLGPHRGTTNASKGFYVRDGNGKHEANVSEIRAMFMQSGTLLENAKNFSRNRIQVILDGDGPVPIDDSPSLILHFLPISEMGVSNQIEKLTDHELLNFVPRIDQASCDTLHNSDGYLMSGYFNEDMQGQYSQLFRDGGVEFFNNGLS